MKNYNLKFKIFNFALSFCILIFAFFIITVIPAFGAEISFDAKTTQIRIGEQFKVDLVIDTEQKSINAFEGKIIFPNNLIDIKEVSDGNSIVNFWIERPRGSQETGGNKQGEIIFSGITPGGFNGENGLILSAIFEARKDGVARLEISEARVLLNDGIGTESSLIMNNLEFRIQNLGTAELLDPKSYIPYFEDKELPESFRPMIAQDASVFDGKWFVAFATADKGTGISHYEIKEYRFKLFAFLNPWRVAVSPHILLDQELKSHIIVRAIDNAGNMRVVEVSPSHSLLWYEYALYWFIIVIGVLIVFIVMMILKRKFLLIRK